MRVPKTVIYTGASVVALLVLIVGGGVAYVWYTGQNETLPQGAVAPVAEKSPAIPTPTKPSPNANASASVQMLTSPVEPGDNVSMSIKTVPTSACSIVVEYNDIPSTDSGLVTKTADEYGIVSWTWTVGADVPRGTWPATVTCNYNGRSAVVRGDLQVGKPS